MIQMLKNTTTAFAFVTMIFMQIYFVLLLLAKPALATETEVNQPSAKAATTVTETKAAVEGEDEINIKLDLKNGLTVKGLTDVVKKLEALDQKNNGSSIQIDQSGLKFTTEGEDVEGADSKKWKRRSSPSFEVGVLKAVEDIVVPVVLFLSMFGFGAYLVYSKARTRREYLETIKALAQSGQPIPPELLQSLNAKMDGGKRWTSDLAKHDANSVQGIKYVFLGIGFCGFFLLMNAGQFAFAMGFLFVVIGAFHIYTSQLIQKQKTNDVAATTTTENK